MSALIRRRDKASADLVDIASYIGARNPSAAERFLDATERCFRRLAEMPEMGEAYEGRDPRLQGLRRVPISGFESYLIFYPPIEGGIEIVRIIHGARNLPSVLAEPD